MDQWINRFIIFNDNFIDLLIHWSPTRSEVSVEPRCGSIDQWTNWFIFSNKQIINLLIYWSPMRSEVSVESRCGSIDQCINKSIVLFMCYKQFINPLIYRIALGINGAIDQSIFSFVKIISIFHWFIDSQRDPRCRSHRIADQQINGLIDLLFLTTVSLIYWSIDSQRDPRCRSNRVADQ